MTTAIRSPDAAAVRTSFRTKVFFAAIAAAGVSLTMMALLLSWQVRDRQRAAITQRITEEARLIADLIAATSLAITGRPLDMR